MQWAAEIQEGEIEEYLGQNIPGKINFSSFTKLKVKTVSQHYSLKYVSVGEEAYIIDGLHYRLRSGQFILVRPDQLVETYISSETNVTGACIYIDPKCFEKKLRWQFADSKSDSFE